MPYNDRGVGHRPTDTSESAARGITPKAPSLRERVLQALVANPGGLTADEIAHRMGQDILSIRPRVTELQKAGRAVDTGARRANRRGKTQIVWKATP